MFGLKERCGNVLLSVLISFNAKKFWMSRTTTTTSGLKKGVVSHEDGPSSGAHL